MNISWVNTQHTDLPKYDLGESEATGWSTNKEDTLSQHTLLGTTHTLNLLSWVSNEASGGLASVFMFAGQVQDVGGDWHHYTLSYSSYDTCILLLLKFKSSEAIGTITP